MIGPNKIRDFLKDRPVPVHSVPVFTWNTYVDSETMERLGIKTGFVPVYKNGETGVRAFSIDEVISKNDIINSNYHLFNTSSDIERYYIEYIKELDGIVIGQAKLSCNSNSGWEKVSEYFITRDKRIFCRPVEYVRGKGYIVRANFKEEKDLLKGYIEGKGYVCEEAPFRISNIGKATKKNPDGVCSVDNQTWGEMSKPILMIFKQYCNIGANRVVDITKSAVNFFKFLRYADAKGLSEEAYKKNPYLQMPLPEIKYDEAFDKKIAFIDRVDNTCILRTMIKDEDEKRMIECARIFVEKKKVTAFRKNYDGKWCKLTLKCNAANWDFSLHEFDEEFVKGTKLEYFGSIVRDISPKHMCKVIWALLTYPITEQLAKAGMKQTILKMIYNSDEERLITCIERLFGHVKDSTSVLKSLGVNKYQFDRICEMMNLYYEDKEMSFIPYGNNRLFAPLRMMKVIYLEQDGTLSINRWSSRDLYYFTDISYLDNESFDNMLKHIVDVSEGCKKETSLDYDFSYCECLSIIKNVYGYSTLNAIADDVLKLTFRKIRGAGGYYSIPIFLYRDYLSIVAQLGESRNMKPYFDATNLNSVVNMHNMATEIMNMRRNRYDMEKFMEAIKKCSKWIYSNETYSVIAPRNPIDVANEGTTLHHCVKSYIKRIADGTTNIVFIRKNDNVDEPFFTVEVDNLGSIQQIHGMQNRNVDTEEGLIDFVKEWAKKRKMKLTNFNKVR